jgi:hypothetical protein
MTDSSDIMSLLASRPGVWLNPKHQGDEAISHETLSRRVILAGAAYSGAGIAGRRNSGNQAESDLRGDRAL